MGAARPFHVDVRVVATTHRDLMMLMGIGGRRRRESNPPRWIPFWRHSPVSPDAALSSSWPDMGRVCSLQEFLPVRGDYLELLESAAREPGARPRWLCSNRDSGSE